MSSQAFEPWQPPPAGTPVGPPVPLPAQRGLVDPQDARAALEARRELGPELEQALVDSFVARVEHALTQRGSTELSERQRRSEDVRADSRNQMILGIVSLVMAIPLTAIASGQLGVLGMIITWVAIVTVNLAYALRKGRRD
jgi:hypothetical protein